MKNSRMIVTAILGLMILATPLLAQEADTSAVQIDDTEDFTKVLTEVKSKLDLTEEQEKEMSQIFREYRKGRRGIARRFDDSDRKGRRSRRMEFGRLNRDTRCRVEEVLGADKVEAFREISRRHRGGPMNGRHGDQEDRRFARREFNDENRDKHFSEMVESLGLKEEQTEKVRKIVDNQMEKIRSVMDEDKRKDMDKVRDRMDDIHAETEKELSSILTPEQMETYRKLAAERREMMRSMRGRRRDGDRR
jgi:Spy/CpxP family protein refolding chaperone